MHITEIPVAILCFTQDGCPACESYMPKLLSTAKRYERCLPIIVVDVHKHPGAADHFRIDSTPTTIITRYGRRSFRFIAGDGDEQLIENLFYSATMGRDCQIGG